MSTTQQDSTAETNTAARIEADPNVPMIIITRDFRGTVAQVMRAHLDPELYAQWSGPRNLSTTINHWDARTGGSWAFTQADGHGSYGFHGCFHEVSDNKIVQTFTFDGQPDHVSLETLVISDLGDGRVRLRAQSLVDSFEGRDAWLASGMETGVNEGYAQLDELIANGTAAA